MALLDMIAYDHIIVGYQSWRRPSSLPCVFAVVHQPQPLSQRQHAESSAYAEAPSAPALQPCALPAPGTRRGLQEPAPGPDHGLAPARDPQAEASGAGPGLSVRPAAGPAGRAGTDELVS